MCNVVNDYNSALFCSGVGGVKSWYAFPATDALGNPTVNWTWTLGKISAVTVIDPLTFALKEWKVQAETSTFVDTGVGERTQKSKSRTQTATIVMHGSNADLVADIDAMGGSNIVVIAKDNRGLNHVLFIDNGGSFQDEFTTGTAMADQYAHTVTLTGNETKKAPIITDLILDSLVNPI